MPPCSVEGCEAPSMSKGMCHKHRERLRLHGLTEKIERKPRKKIERHACIAIGCSAPAICKGFCQKHYYRNHNNGSPYIAHRPNVKLTPIDVWEIRTLRSKGVKAIALAKQFKVARNTIYYVTSCLPTEGALRLLRTPRPSTAKCSLDQSRSISSRRWSTQGRPLTSMGERVTRLPTISRSLHRSA
jgi:hypothetical protein